MNVFTLTITTNKYDYCLEFDNIDECLYEYQVQLKELSNEDKATLEVCVFNTLSGKCTTIREVSIKSIEW